MRSVIAITLGVCLALPATAEPERYVLRNGARIVLDPIEDADAIAVIAAYDTGYADDPAGLSQGAHLAEHLRATAATDSFDAGAALAELNRLGSANAETLADLTYYDYALPREHLGLALAVEHERLTSLRVTPADFAREAPRVAAEVDAVLAAPTRPLGKFALMACIQGWRHDATTVSVRTDPARDAQDDLSHLLACANPATLTLMITGGFDPEPTKALIERTIGAVPAGRAVERRGIDWDAQPPTRRLSWDVPARAVAIACPPPEDPLARALLTPIGMIALLGSGSIEGVISAHASGHTAPVGATPFHALVVIEDDADADDVIRRLHERLDNAAENAALYRTQVPASLRPFTLTDPKVLRQRATSMARLRGVDERAMYAITLGNSALQGHLRERLGGEDMADRIQALSTDEFSDVVRRALARESRRVIIIEPAHE